MIWDHTVKIADVFHDDDLAFDVKRDLIVARFARLKQKFPEDWDLELLLDELSDTTGDEEFDDVWESLYDWADDNRVWIETV